MASAGLLFLMLMSSSFLISTVIVSTSADQNQEQEKYSKLLDKIKKIGIKSLEIIEKILRVSSPFMELIPNYGSFVHGFVDLIANVIDKKINGDPLLALMNEFDSLNIKLDQYHIEQKWDTWASGAYHKPELKINIAWRTFRTMMLSVGKAKDVKETERHKQEFVNTYPKYEPATKILHSYLTAKGPTTIQPLGDLLAQNVKCHEKDIGQYTVFIYQLFYKGNIMNFFYYKLKNIESTERVKDAVNDMYDAASVMFHVHMKCIVNSMEYIKKDVESIIVNSQEIKKRSKLAEKVCSSLVKDYNRYDWMVVAFMTKKSQQVSKSMDHHVLTGFTEVTKGGISVAVARQVKGNHTKAALVKQTIRRCIDSSVPCHKVAEKLKKCNETIETIERIPVSKTYTAVHAYIREAHDSHSTKEAKDEDYEVSADPEDSSAQTPFIYKGKCKKHLMMSGNFVVLIKSDEEIMTGDLCSKLNCGGDQRGKCVKVEGIFLAMCECKMPYYGEQCEKNLDDYKRELEKEIRVNKNLPQVTDKRSRTRQ